MRKDSRNHWKGKSDPFVVEFIEDEFAVFDKLPKPLRDALNYAKVGVSAIQVLELGHKGYRTYELVEMIKNVK